jgi:hypothetical protein
MNTWRRVRLAQKVGEHGKDEVVSNCFAALGISEAHGIVPDVYKITPLELLGEKVIPEAARM